MNCLLFLSRKKPDPDLTFEKKWIRILPSRKTVSESNLIVRIRPCFKHRILILLLFKSRIRIRQTTWIWIRNPGKERMTWCCCTGRGRCPRCPNTAPSRSFSSTQRLDTAHSLLRQGQTLHRSKANKL